MEAVAQKLLDLRGTHLSLDDKYVLDDGCAYMTGIQALVRLAMSQRRRDALHGLNTAGFIAGYRGSPLGNFDTALWQADRHLKAHELVFRPAVNEDLAATAVWGSQQAGLAGQGKFDGVVGWWYGKGPGADRSGDAFRHANLAGTAKHGGVVALYGDDHSCKSSSIPHQSEHVMIGTGIPIFYPTSVQEILDFGVHAVAMSRIAGLWTSMKLVSEIVETSSSVDVSLERVRPILNLPLELPPEGLNIRWPDTSLDQEARLYQYKLPAAIAYARANQIDSVTWACAPGQARVGVVASGKGYLDMIEALRILGIDQTVARAMGLCVYRVGMIWPLEPMGIREFATGLQELIVVEEKRPILESQIKDELYSLSDSLRPRIIGKGADGKGEWSTPASQAPLISHFELQPEPIAMMLATRFLKLELADDIRGMLQARLQHLSARKDILKIEDVAERKAYFCSGCPHNSSTRVPEGSRALGGIGCHFLSLMMDRDTETFTQMGGEGASWVGAAPFTKEPHVFVNIGDGTYFHSGLLAIRQAVAANVNITYKILYNDAVGMTGGQAVDGVLTVARLTRQLQAEGVGKIVVVTDEPALIQSDDGLAPGVTVRHRGEHDAVQRELRVVPGVTALVFAQTCASEKRRRRKRQSYPDPDLRVFIHTDICEGCGDCSTQSNCLSVEPIQTELGIKRQINQSSCNKDFSCVNGFCPSFVTVHTKDVRVLTDRAQVPEGWPEAPVLPELQQPCRIVLAGVGGMGVITIGALLGMAAHIDKRAVRVMDMGGMAQKGGTVYSYVQLANNDSDISATKVPELMCDVLISADPVVAGHSATLSRLKPQGVALVNQDGTPTAQFIRARDWLVPIQKLLQRVTGQLPQGKLITVPAAQLALQLFGDALYANQLMLGMAWQQGLIPLRKESIQQAIELNGVAVQKNLDAFRMGCHLGHNTALMASMVANTPASQRVLDSFDDIVADRVERLQGYWNAAYAAKYQNLIEPMRTVLPEPLAVIAAQQLYRVMAYKDEYEVARLMSLGSFKQKLVQQFGAQAKVSYHLAVPLLSRKDPTKKRMYGPWMGAAFKVLGRLQWLRETALDPFSGTQERQLERQWRDQYMALLASLAENPALVQRLELESLLKLPDQVRGYGHIKVAAMQQAMQQWEQLLHEQVTELKRSAA